MLFNKLLEIEKVNDSIGNINYREAVRAVVMRKNQILLVHSKNKDYKFPGGGVKKGENRIDALKREVEEETGYVCTKISKKIGMVTEKSKDKFVDNQIFKMISYYYVAEVSDERKEQKLDAYEAKLQFKPVWIDLKKAIDNNNQIIQFESANKANWIERETYVLGELEREFYKK